MAMPMSGAGMLMKSLGIDPQQMQLLVEAIPTFAQNINARVTAMELKLDKILAILESSEVEAVESNSLALEN